MFSDGFFLISEAATGLQNQIYSLWKSAKKHGLKLNLNKIRIIGFFEKVDFFFFCRLEKWFHGDRELEVVNKYQYFGLCFSTKLSVNAAVRDLSGKDKNIVKRLLSILCKLENHSLEPRVKLFKSQNQLIVLYNAEV